MTRGVYTKNTNLDNYQRQKKSLKLKSRNKIYLF